MPEPQPTLVQLRPVLQLALQLIKSRPGPWPGKAKNLGRARKLPAA